MHDLAIVLSRVGKRSEALAVYKALVPRIDLLASTSIRVSVLLEAAHASMAAAAAQPSAPSAPATDAPKPAPIPNLDEAIAYLREARQKPPTQLTGDVLLSLVLALDRSGDKAQADAALSDAHRTGARVRSGSLDYLAAAEDKLALEALSLEGSDKAQAAKAWESYLAGAGGKGPWAAPARARLDALKKGGVRAGAKPAGSAAGRAPSGGKPR